MENEELSEKSENQNTEFLEQQTEEESGSISFEDLGLDEITLEAISKKGFVTPSPIQVLAIPRLLNGDANVIARARTGTGKTAAFGLPLVQSLRKSSDCVKAIILEPTRELAMQTATEMASFTTGIFPRTAVVYGGASMGEQIRSLKKGVEIVVGTPGRVQDLMERGVLDISKIEYFILDEGDEMLDMGFVDDIEHIFSSANPDCRVLLFSATIPAPILNIAKKFMGDYEIVEEEGHEEEPLLIEQKYWFVRESEKIEALVRLIDISKDFYGLVFVQKKTDADYVARSLDERGYEVAALHGDIPQGQREKILSRFRSGKTRILVATDVAARGIDIGGLTHVVNYELPFDGPTYVHRIGRTGRAGSSGVAVTFVRPEERRRLQYLKNAIRRSAKGEMKEDSVPSIDKVIEEKKERLFGDVKKKLGLENENKETEVDSSESLAEKNDLPDENEKSSSVLLSSGLKKGGDIFDLLADELCSANDPKEVLSSLLALTYGSSLDRSRYGKVSVLSKDGGKKSRERSGENGDRASRRRGSSAGPGQMRLYVQMGWHDGYNPKKIADFFAGLLHIPGRKVDSIDMSDKFCLLNLPLEDAKKALAMSQSDPKIPHMHADVRAESSDRVSRSFSGGRGGDKNFRRGDRYAMARSDRSRRPGSSHENAGGRRRPSVQRNSKAAVYKKGNVEEY